MSPLRRLAVAVVCLGVTLSLAGCGGIPDVGPVTDGPRLGESPVGGLVEPPGPQAGADPEGIVRGFIQAGGGFSQEHEVARSYLVSSVQTSWRPDSRVTVYPAPGSLTFHTETGTQPDADPSASDGGEKAQPGPTVVTVTVPVRARVDENGILVNAAAGEKAQFTYTLQYQAGLGWRISELDDGILLSAEDFRFTFTDVSLYFPDRTGQYLVPDIRWFPVQGSPSTRAVRQLLEGPTPWLDVAVTSGFPLGTDLATKNVTVEDGEATVDLTKQALDATEDQRTQLLAQLGATLSGENSAVERVRVTVERADFVSGSTLRASYPSPAPVRKLVGSGTDPFAINAAGKLVRIIDEGAQEVVGVDALNAVHGVCPAVAPAETQYAVLSADRSALHVLQAPRGGTSGKGGNGSAGTAPTVITGRSLVAPSFDPEGWVWTASEQAQGRLTAASPKGMKSALAAPWLGGSTVKALRLSRDGSRVALIVRRGAHATVLVAAVARAPDGTPVRLGTPLDVLPDLTGARAVSWTGEASLAILGRRAGRPEQPWLVDLGGEVVGSVPVAGGRSLAAKPLLPGLALEIFVGTAHGQVLKLVGGKWLAVAAAQWPAMPG